MATKKPLSVSVVIVTRNRKEELFDCLRSIVNQTRKPDEFVVIDNASNEDIKQKVGKEFPSAKFIKSHKNLGGAGGRNLGYVNTHGEYILFMDDDAAADKDLITHLLDGFKPKVGIVQPKIYDKKKRNVIQGIGHGINLLTGRVYGIGVGEKDKGQYDEDREVPMVGCTWMVKRGVFEKVGLYDDDIFIPYEDSDFCIRATKAGYKVMYIHKGKVWHQGPKNTGVPARLQWIGITTPERAYRVSRNKIIFMKKHAPALNLILFSIIFVPIYAFIHSLIMLTSLRLDILRHYWKGLFSGLLYFPLTSNSHV